MVKHTNKIVLMYGCIILAMYLTMYFKLLPNRFMYILVLHGLYELFRHFLQWLYYVCCHAPVLYRNNKKNIAIVLGSYAFTTALTLVRAQAPKLKMYFDESHDYPIFYSHILTSRRADI